MEGAERVVYVSGAGVLRHPGVLPGKTEPRHGGAARGGLVRRCLKVDVPEVIDVPVYLRVRPIFPLDASVAIASNIALVRELKPARNGQRVLILRDEVLAKVKRVVLVLGGDEALMGGGTGAAIYSAARTVPMHLDRRRYGAGLITAPVH